MPAITRYLSIYRTFSRREQIVLLISIVLLPCCWFALRLLGLQRFQAGLEYIPTASRVPLSQVEATKLGVALNRAANHIFPPGNCLTRSLLLRSLLRCYGTPSELRIGVRFDEKGPFLAHAWVEQHGVPITDCPESIASYAAFDQPLSPAAFP